MSRPTAAVLLDHAAGVVVASAAADALGAPHEFGAPVSAGIPLIMQGGGPFGFAPGEWTDDTQMALAILTPLSSGDRQVQSVENGFLAWFAARPRDVGNQTRAVLSTGSPLTSAARRHYERSPRGSAGNGGLMRIGPAGLSFPGEPARIAGYASAVTTLTHADADCIDASVLWAVGIDRIIHTAPLSTSPFDFADAIRRGLEYLDESRRARWSALIDEACTHLPAAFSANGWVVGAFQAALAAIVHTPVPTGDAPCRHLVDAIEAAIRIGGDTDTVAAIAGSLLGARWGATAIPLPWRSVVRGERRRGDEQLRADDLDAMGRLAFHGGASDSVGFPAATQMLPYYRAHYPLGPHPVELGGARFGGLGGLDAALKTGADVVVSLCRAGKDEVPPSVEHHRVGLVDGSPADNPNLAFLLADTADFIGARVAEGKHVYAHCVAADNRAPVVALTYLMRHAGMGWDDAAHAVDEGFGHLPNVTMMAGAQHAATLPTFERAG